MDKKTYKITFIIKIWSIKLKNKKKRIKQYILITLQKIILAN